MIKYIRESPIPGGHPFELCTNPQHKTEFLNMGADTDLMTVIPSTTEDIPLDKITIGVSQARQRGTKVEPDDDLVLSIKQHGLISPIVVRKVEDGQYELLVGQRRLRAHEHLKRQTIRAYVVRENIDNYDAKMLSVIENVARRDMKYADLTDAIEFFMEKYNSTKSVAEQLGLHPNTVRKYVNFGRLPTEIQADVRNKDYRMNHALKALKALGDDETEVDIGMLRETALEMKKLSIPAQNILVEKINREPTSSPHDVGEKIRTQQLQRHMLKIGVTDDQLERIGRYRKRKDLERNEDAANELIDIGLDTTDV